MYNDSIIDFALGCLTDFENAQEDFLKSPAKLPEFAASIKEKAIQAGIRYIEHTLASCDEALRKSPVRKAKGWRIVRRDPKTLVTCLGDVHFNRTLFRHKDTGTNCHLLDRIVGLTPNERLTEDAVAELLKEAVQTTYRKGGEEASILSSVSKETVKDKIHGLVFEPEKTKEPAAQKKVVDYLFIDADEDHIALQFNEKRSGLATGENGHKINTEIAKLVYVYEGVEKEAPRSRRRRLVNPHYFSGVYKGKANRDLWDEVYAYLDRTYDLPRVKKIYLGADGGMWMKDCLNRIDGVTYALDEFHLRKYLEKMTAHLLDSAEEVTTELVSLIQDGQKEQFRKKGGIILSYAQNEAQKERITAAMTYVLGNWDAAKVRLCERETLHGCSAEGHVSHVLSARMSSRPMGWSRRGADRMAHLRAYYFNGGSMLALVKNQSAAREELPKAAGAEEMSASVRSIMSSERGRFSNGKYVDAIQASISPEASKMAWFNGHVWGL